MSILTIHKRHMWAASRKSIAIAVILAVILTILVDCQFAYSDSDTQLTKSSSPIAKEVSKLHDEIKHLVRELEYSETIAEDFANMVIGWRNDKGIPVLAVLKKQLSDSKNEYAQGKINSYIFTRNEIIKVKQLCLRIRYEIEYKKEIFDLDDVTENKKANCLGFSQIFFLLANTIGLQAKTINVDEFANPDMLSTDGGHVASLVQLSNDQMIMVDLAQHPYQMISKPFELQKEFDNDGIFWELKDKTNSLGIHRKIQIIDRDGLVVFVYNNRSVLDIELGQPDKAISNLSRTIELDPNFAAAYINRGNAYFKIHEYEKAASDYNKVITFDPNNAEAYKNRGIIYGAQKEYSEALSDFNTAIKLNPGLADAYQCRGTIYVIYEQWTEAIVDYTKTINLDPNLAMAYVRRGRAYSIIGKSEEAKKDFLKAVELNTELKENVNKLADLHDLNLKID